MTKSTIWISYDLGVRGDYEGLYAWLDSHRAKECGDSLAVLTYEHNDRLPGELKSDLESAVHFDKRTRVYVIYREQNRNKGSFIFGGRHAAPWSGYSTSDAEVVDEEI